MLEKFDEPEISRCKNRQSHRFQLVTDSRENKGGGIASTADSTYY